MIDRFCVKSVKRVLWPVNSILVSGTITFSHPSRKKWSLNTSLWLRLDVSLSPTNVRVYADWTSVSCPFCKPLHGRYNFVCFTFRRMQVIVPDIENIEFTVVTWSTCNQGHNEWKGVGRGYLTDQLRWWFLTSNFCCVREKDILKSPYKRMIEMRAWIK